MTVLHVGDNLDPRIGGVHTTITGFLRAAVELGWNARCISLDDPHQTLRRGFPAESVSKTTGILGRKWGFAKHQALAAAEQMVKESDAVFVHALYLYHTVWAWRTACKFSKPVFVIPHGGLDPYCFSYRRLRKMAWLQTFGKAMFRDSVIIYASEGEQSKSTARIGNTSHVVLPWPVSDVTFAAARGYPPRQTAKRLLFAGRLHPMKRILETVRAFARINPNCELVIAGPETPELQVCHLEAAAGSLWKSKIIYLGELGRQDLHRVMGDSDGLVLYSFRENFGHSVAEAMAFGLPCSISEGIDIHGIVSETSSGKVHQVTSQDDVEFALNRLLNVGPHEWEQMSRNASSAAQEHFAFSKFKARLAELLTSSVKAA